ncbi:hypothetical protein OCU04_001072 [Sclerotinia nivalis]|uniref:Uncharacterized protein n=1 Tax=Sclerotinia nivalis TaxID=352851 RepID=A0A9X0AXD9_9HELO|nr:hypothetical protein OCU04_001072 [Sclerotinia nivalis]
MMMTTKYLSHLLNARCIYNGLNKSQTSPCSQQSQTLKFGSRVQQHQKCRSPQFHDPYFPSAITDFQRPHRTNRTDPKYQIRKQKNLQNSHSPFLALLFPTEVYQF